MHLFGSTIIDLSNNIYLKTDVSGDSIVILDDIPNTPSFYIGFMYYLSGTGLLSLYIGDVDNNFKIDIDENLTFYVNGISIHQIVIDLSYNEFIQFDIKFLKNQLSMTNDELMNYIKNKLIKNYNGSSMALNLATPEVK